MPPAASPETILPAALPLVEPADAVELARVLADAHSAGQAVLPRGGGTKMEWGNPPRAAHIILSTRKLDRVLEHAAGDMTATVQAGCTVTSLQNELALRGQRLAIDPLWPDRATIGGVLATNDSGPLRGAFGSLRDLIIGITVALADGTLARSGGKVVKNVAGYDLPKLMVGALGTLGVLTEATFRLHPLPQTARTFEFSAPTPGDATGCVLAVHDSTLSVAALQVVAAGAAPVTVAVRVEGSAAAVDDAAERLSGVGTPCGAELKLPTGDVWAEREGLWNGPDVVCKVAFLPARLADLCAAIGCCMPDWKLVAQGVGVGLLGIRAVTEDDVPRIVRAVRQELAALGGSLVVLRCPPWVKRRVDLWGDAGDALPLMRRVKQQFDPTGVLNPGRFVGGI